nr:hypothetical protein [Miltoncostaea marina]
MAHGALHLKDVAALVDEERAEGVAAVVGGRLRDLGLEAGGVPDLRAPVAQGHDPVALAARHHQVVAGRGLQGPPPGGEVLGQRRHDLDGRARAGLRALDLPAGRGLLDEEHALADVAPLEGEDLLGPQAGQIHERDHQGVALAHAGADALQHDGRVGAVLRGLVGQPADVPTRVLGDQLVVDRVAQEGREHGHDGVGAVGGGDPAAAVDAHALLAHLSPELAHPRAVHVAQRHVADQRQDPGVEDVGPGLLGRVGPGDAALAPAAAHVVAQRQVRGL